MSRELSLAEQQDSLPLPQPPLVEWLEALSHDSPFESEDPAIWDADAPRLALAPVLISLLKDRDRNVRVRVITALGNLGAQAHRVLPVLRAALKEIAVNDDDDAVRDHAAHNLLQVGPEPDTDLGGFIDALQNPLEILRFHAAISVGHLGREGLPAVPALVRTAMWDEDPAVRVAAAVALWKIDRRAPAVVLVLTNALADDNEIVCWMAADALGQMGPDAREAVPAIRQAMERNFKVSLVKKGLALALKTIDPVREGDYTKGNDHDQARTG